MSDKAVQDDETEDLLLNAETVTQQDKNMEAIAFLHALLSDETGYDEEVWPALQESLERSRTSSRRLFDVYRS